MNEKDQKLSKGYNTTKYSNRPGINTYDSKQSKGGASDFPKK